MADDGDKQPEKEMEKKMMQNVSVSLSAPHIVVEVVW